jgi:Spy/CpxP family protein refolding chaperone
MFTAIWRTVFASALFLTLTVSAWAAEEKQAPPAKAEKMGEMEKKPEMGMPRATIPDLSTAEWVPKPGPRSRHFKRPTA